MDASNIESKLNNTPSLPFDHDLILKLVLKHVGRADVDDLKNCRLVCHSWNKVAVQVLEQQHGCAIELDCEKIVDYKALLWYTQLPGLPQMNSTECRDPLASLRLSLNIVPLSNSENLSEAAKWVQLLMFYPHLRIAFLYCTYIQTEKDHLPLVALANLELFNLLKLASSHLTSITIFADTYTAGDMPYFEEFHFECYGSVEFPKLSSIHYQIYVQEQNGMLGLTKHLVAVMHRAPKLTELNLDVYEENEEKRCGKSLKMIMEGCATYLEKLKITEGFPGQVMKILKKTNFPKLKTLEMKNVTCSFNEFILFCRECPALSHIDFLWFSVDIVEDNLNIAQFPTLANINHLGLYPYHRTLPEYLEQIRLNFTTMLTRFPCLNSMGISLGVLFMLGAHLKNSGQLVPPLDQYPAFANVSSLEIQRVFAFNIGSMFDLVDMAEQIYNHSFPHLRKLVIKVDIFYSIELFKQKLCECIEFLCRPPGLKVLEIHNYAHDWLGQIPKDIQILQGLNSLKLVPPSTTTTAVDDNGCGLPRIDIMDFLTRFPVLERLQFGKQTLSRTEIQTIRSAMSSISRFEKATPRHQ